MTRGAAGDRLRGPCSLCGLRSSCSWRRLPQCAGDKAGAPACNACYVSVARQATKDPGNMDKMLAARSELQKVQGPRRRCRIAKLLRSRPCPGQIVHRGSRLLQTDERADSNSKQQLQPQQQQQQQQGRQPSSPPATPPQPLQQQRQWQQRQLSNPPPPPPPQLPPPAPQLPQASTLPPPSQPLWAVQLGDIAGAAGALPFEEPAAVSAGQQPPALQLAHWDGSSGRSTAIEPADQAWRAACKLPGRDPELLAHIPALWLLPPGPRAAVRLVGVLLTEVQLPAPGLGFEVQQALRLVVYCGLTGQLLRRRDWVQQEECVLERHPRHSILAWNSSEGWQLLFPEVTSHNLQTLEFTGTISRFGWAAVTPGPAGAAPAVTQQPADKHLALPLPPACQPWQRAARGAAWCSAATSCCDSRLPEGWGEDVPLEEAVRSLGIHLTDTDLACLRCGLGDGHEVSSAPAEPVAAA